MRPASAVVPTEFLKLRRNVITLPARPSSFSGCCIEQPDFEKSKDEFQPGRLLPGQVLNQLDTNINHLLHESKGVVAEWVTGGILAVK
jgi:hypothetical protein